MRFLLLFALLFTPTFAVAAEPKPFAPENLTAWCIVPFDGKKRGPEERVAMLKRLGFTRYAYDWRTEHLPTFDKELGLLKHENIAMQGVWFPAGVGKDGEFILDLLKKHKIETELWVMLPQPDAKLSQDDKVKTTAAFLAALAKRVAPQGCKIGVYNHGGWAGEPENMVAVVKASEQMNVGIVYNLHHGHDHLAKFDDYLKLMKPHLYSISLNGMEKDGDKNGKKLLVISDGPEDTKLFRSIIASGYAGPFNILGHTDDDAEDRLTDNLNGFIRAQWYAFTTAERTKTAFLTPTANSLQIRIAAPKPGAPLAFIASNFSDAVRVKLLLATDFAKTGFVVTVDREGAEPIEGVGVVAEGRMIFTPRFPPTPGVRYRVVLDRAALRDAWDTPVRAFVTVRKIPPVKPTEIENLFPTADLLPENTLRWYIQFTAPMARGDVYRHLRLLDARGKPVVHPFLELDEELWSPDGKRLTVFFDPGRVKRGLKPREEDGPVLMEGKTYTLVIDRVWEDEAGFPLKESLKKTFKVTKPDDAPVDPKSWKVAAPRDAKGVLKVTFEKPLDRALAERMLRVRGPDDKPISVSVTVNATQTGVELRPTSQLWVAGKYQLVVDKRLEDVCGNRVGRAFEIDGIRPIPENADETFVVLPFAVK